MPAGQKYLNKFYNFIKHFRLGGFIGNSDVVHEPFASIRRRRDGTRFRVHGQNGHPSRPGFLHSDWLLSTPMYCSGMPKSFIYIILILLTDLF
jgi:hypothetical protein